MKILSWFITLFMKFMEFYVYELKIEKTIPYFDEILQKPKATSIKSNIVIYEYFPRFFHLH